MGQDVIELNGKRYDAITGAYLGKSHVVPKHIMLGHRTVDGFARPSHTAPKPTPAPTTEHAVNHHARPQPPEPTPHAAHTHAHASPKPLKAHHPERAKTLMRRGVHKPAFSLKPAIKLQTPAEMMAKPASDLARKHSASAVDPFRLKRAASIAKHQAIRHFLPTDRSVVTHTVAAHVPVIAVRPAPLSVHAQHAVQPVKKHADVFEAAIARATSHQQPRANIQHKRGHRRLVNTLATVGAFLVIGGFIGYLNLPQLELRVASVHAGFRASMPAYTPTGYALDNGVKRDGGTVSLSFRSGDSQYTLTQQSSNWNSQTLLDNTLALNGQHETVQKNGQTIYIYGNGANAAWVTGGVRYDIAGNAQLSADEIAAIATSL